jgi:predicted secreted acid phosphatase
MITIDDILRRIDLHTGERAAALLRGVIDCCARGAPAATAVFDLDSTLLNNRPRQAMILREYGEQRGIESLKRAKPEHWTGWAFKPAMVAAGLDPEVADAIGDDFKAFWEERFFTSDYCAIDTPIAGAPAFVRAVAATDVRVCYVTGRHEGMRHGTEESFRGGGFPLPNNERIQLLMKPSLEETDDEFKAETHAALRSLGPVATVFDNEPMHVNDYVAAFGDALVVHLATDHSPRAVLVAGGVPSIADFSDFAPGG